MSRPEVRDVLGHMSNVSGLMARLMYGGGLRLMEVIRMRVKPGSGNTLSIPENCLQTPGVVFYDDTTWMSPV